jgi:hypothetical protein
MMDARKRAGRYRSALRVTTGRKTGKGGRLRFCGRWDFGVSPA